MQVIYWLIFIFFLHFRFLLISKRKFNSHKSVIKITYPKLLGWNIIFPTIHFFFDYPSFGKSNVATLEAKYLLLHCFTISLTKGYNTFIYDVQTNHHHTHNTFTKAEKQEGEKATIRLLCCRNNCTRNSNLIKIFQLKKYIWVRTDGLPQFSYRIWRFI